MALKLKTLWADPVVKEVYEMRDKYFQLNDSMAQCVMHCLRFHLDN